MKKITSFLAITAILVISCTKNTGVTGNNSNSNNSTVLEGNFTITKFTDSNVNEDKTAHFSGYVFTFNADGKIAAVKNGIAAQGTYIKKPSHEGEAAKLTISFNADTLRELNKSWQADVISDSQMLLSDDDNASEVLQFTAR